MIISPIPSTAVTHSFSTRAIANDVTTGEGRVGWISAGSGRSTSDILWSCFSILLVCTWKCVHFNVPSIDDSEAGWHRWGILCWPGTRLLSKWMNKVGWMIAIILAPELGVAIAMHQYLGAREWLKKLRVDKPTEIESQDVGSQDAEVKLLGVGRDGVTKAHTFFANMGGFIAKICVLPSPQQGSTSSDKSDKTSPVPEMPRELIREIKDCQELGQYIYFQVLIYIRIDYRLIVSLFFIIYLSVLL